MTNIEEIQQTEWDYLVVGTGMGGATLGHALAEAGKRVLFLEKGPAGFLHDDTLRGAYPESSFARAEVPSPRNAKSLAKAGRYNEEIRDGNQPFVPFIGSGAGGSSALYGMALERFMPSDFKAGGWPLDYEDLAPWYLRAERLYRVRGGRDPLRPSEEPLPAPPALSPQNAELFAHFTAQGLHPYALPLACERLDGCVCCQGYLCARGCKNDAARICLEPAVRVLGASLLDDCEVIRLEASPQSVSGVVCRWRQQELVLRARNIVLAAGALNTPALLLRSASREWPQGLANASGLVGRNLMRHFVDLHLVFTRAKGANPLKEIGFSDLYETDEGRLGTVQSFGILPPGKVLAASMVDDMSHAAPWASPLLRWIEPILAPLLTRLFKRGVLLASIMEDQPDAANRVVANSRLEIEYRVRADDLPRLEAFRRQVRKVLQPYRVLSLHQAGKNSMLAHVCGTCRFGTDPASSVLDPYNRAHGLANLYVVDGSFFPSSGGTNPALTIAANALRVASHLLHAPTQGRRIAMTKDTTREAGLPATKTEAFRQGLFRMVLTSELIVDASARRIWEILTDFNAYAAWNKAIPKAQGQPVAGTVLEVDIEWPGLKRGGYRLEITGVATERELRWLGHFKFSGLMDGDHRFLLEPVTANRTRLTQTENFSGLLIPFFAPWLKENVLQGFQQMNLALKSRAERPG